MFCRIAHPWLFAAHVVMASIALTPVAAATWDGGCTSGANLPQGMTRNSNILPAANDERLFSGTVRLTPNGNCSAGRTPAVAAGANESLLHADFTGLVEGDPDKRSNHKLTLPISLRSMIATQLSRAATDVELYSCLTTAITISAGTDQCTTIMVALPS